MAVSPCAFCTPSELSPPLLRAGAVEPPNVLKSFPIIRFAGFRQAAPVQRSSLKCRRNWQAAASGVVDRQLQAQGYFEFADIEQDVGLRAARGRGDDGLPQKFNLSGEDKVPSRDSASPRLVVIGGGAAGMFGAIRAKELCPSLEVTILEKGQPLVKVKVSGGGRCNVTTGLYVDPLPLSAQYPRGHKELRGSFFRTHGPRETAEWFRQRGVALKTEADGRMFPVSDSSSSIINCLLAESRRLGVNLCANTAVRQVALLPEGGFAVAIRPANASRDHVRADYVLMATGGTPEGFALARDLGHTIIEPRSSLFTFRIKDSSLSALAGVSFSSVRGSLEVAGLTQRDPNLTQEGPLLITHWGVSGPLVLRLSAWAARHLHTAGYAGSLMLDLAPAHSGDAVMKALLRQKEVAAKKKVGGGAPPQLQLPRRFWLYMLGRLDVDAEGLWAAAPNSALQRLAGLVKRLELHISGKGEFKEEFVTAGGVPLKELELRTMESKLRTGLYFAGEVVDVDGLTGGFNFQNAWTGGYIAGSSVARAALASAAGLQASA